jgi:hypothetical protein
MKMYQRLVTMVAAAAAFASAPVQTQEVRLIARVPFEFSMNNVNLPRDTYRLSRMDGHKEMLLIRGERKGAFVRVSEREIPRGGAGSSLVFHRYGDQYFLREVRWEGTARLDLPETKAEQDAAEGRTGRAAAIMQTVVIAADDQ